MKKIYYGFLGLLLVSACQPAAEQDDEQLEIEGTWQLVSAETIRGDSSSVDYFEGKEMIKMLNATHFSFLNHDTNKGQDSTASFVAGGGTYELDGKQYTEHLQYCSARGWEGNDFSFTLEIKGDTLIQKGKEEVPQLGVEQEIVEKYVRLK